MKLLGVSTVLVAALVVSGARGGDDEAEKEELEKLQGTWRAVQFIQAGKPETAEKLKKIKVVFEGKKLTVTTAVRTQEATVKKLDPSKAPAKIDIQPSDQKKPVLGIYKLEKNRLTLCYSTDGRPERPKEFKATSKDETTSLLVLEREAE
jgi:uncharacterized protein (TIGR03067 family)